MAMQTRSKASTSSKRSSARLAKKGASPRKAARTSSSNGTTSPAKVASPKSKAKKKPTVSVKWSDMALELRQAIVLQTLKSAVPSGSAAQGPYNVQRIAFRHTLQNLLGVGSGFRKAELRQAVRDFRKDVIALRKLLWKTSVEVANRSMGVGSEHPAGWESLRDDLIELGTELNRVTIRVTDLVNTLDQYKVLWTKIVTAKAKASATVEQAEYDAALAAAEKQGPGRVFNVKMQKLWNKKDYGGLEW